ncbi:MAG: hypothetical protein RL095_2327 [Verrucomicrobiota bacterium]|jgi:VCBS repeat-containing protein
MLFTKPVVIAEAGSAALSQAFFGSFSTAPTSTTVFTANFTGAVLKVGGVIKTSCTWADLAIAGRVVITHLGSESAPVLGFSTATESATATVTFTNVNDLATGSLVITGTAAVGMTLTADASGITDADGLPASFASTAYRWKDANNVQVGTGPSLLLTSAMQGKILRCQLVFVDAKGGGESVLSAPTLNIAPQGQTPPNTGTIANAAPTGSVLIVGEAVAGKTLTADASSVRDADGMGALTYRWKDSANNQLATGQSFVLTSSHVGKILYCQVTYLDFKNNVESVFSSPVTIASTSAPPSTSNLVLSGSTEVGATITAGFTPPSGATAVTYKFFSGGVEVQSGAANSLVLTGAMASKTLSASVSYTLNNLSSTVNSSFSLWINSAPTGTLLISDTTPDQGQVLNALDTLGDADGKGTVTYTWKDAAGNTLGSGATYTPGLSAVGKQIKVVASWTDAHGKAESVSSVLTSAVTNTNDAPTGSVTITGAASQGQTLMASNNIADGDGLGAITYTWKDAAGNTLGVGSSLTLTQAHVGKQIKVTASYVDLGGTSEAVTSNLSSSVANVEEEATGSVNISGTVQEGAAVNAVLSADDVDGGISIVGYQWQISTDNVNFSNLAGATGVSYGIASDQSQVGKYLRVTAISTDAFGGTTGFTSASQQIANVNDAATATLAISGTVEEGGSVSASVASLADEDGAASVSSYAWEVSANGSSGWSAAPGTANASGYSIPSDQSLVGQYLRFSITTNDGTVLSSAGSLVANVEDEADGTLAISGTVEEGGTVSADVSGLSDVDGGIASTSYQWQFASDADYENGTWSDISGATSNSYQIATDQSQVYGYLRLKARSTDNFGGTTDFTATSTYIANVNDAPSLSISGTATQGQTLTANLSDVDGVPPSNFVSYTWKDGDDNTLGTDSTLVLTQAHVGKTISVSASYVDAAGTSESLSSTATNAVANVNDAPTGSVTISGILRQGYTLTADSSSIDDADGLGTLHYQWKAGGVNVGSDSSTYALGADDVGKAVTVTVSYTDGFSANESVISAATAAVAAPVSFSEKHLDSGGADAMVNTVTGSHQSAAAIAILSGGGYVVAWQGNQSGNYDIYAQIYDADGVAVGTEIAVNATTTLTQEAPVVAALDGGGFAIAWAGEESGDSNIYLRLFDAAGVAQGVETQINSASTATQRSPEVTLLASGGFLLAWAGDQNGSYDIYARRFDASGVAQGAEITVASNPAIDDRDPSLAVLSNGDFIVAWMKDYETYFQRLDANGVPQGGATLCDNDFSGNTVSVAALSGGGFIITWSAYYDYDDVYGRIYDAAGNALGERFLVSFPYGYHYNPDVVGLADGGFRIVWTGDDDIYARSFSANGTARDDGERLNTVTESDQRHPDAAVLADGGLVTVWSGRQNGNFDIYQHYDSLVITPLSSFVKTINETVAMDELKASTGQIFPDEEGWSFTPETNVGLFGTLSINADGTYLYTPDATKINLLPAGAYTESFTFNAGNGSESRTLTLNVAIQGADDGEFIVNTAMTSDQYNPAIAQLGDGGFVVTWYGLATGQYHIYARRYDAELQPVGEEFQVNSENYGTGVAVSDLADGGLLFTWERYNTDNGTYDIYARRFDRELNPQGSDFMVNTTGISGEFQFEPSVSDLADGGYLLSWHAGNSGTDDIFARRYDSDFNAIGNDFVVNSNLSNSQKHGKGIGLADGGFLVTWSLNEGDIFARRFDASGNPVGNDFAVNTTTAGTQDNAMAIALGDGGFLITWESEGSICARRFDSAFNPVGNEFVVSTTSGSMIHAQAASLAGGGFVITWEGPGGNKDILARIYDGDFNPLGNDFVVNTTTLNDQATPRISGLDDGSFVVSWHGNNPVTGSTDIFAAHFAADGTRISHSQQSGTVAADILTGSGNANDAFINIGAGDSALGLAGDDVFALSASDFTAINGGAGTDTLMLSGTVNLADFSFKLTSIERFEGGAGTDVFTGTDADESFVYSAGGDSIDAGNGTDTLLLRGIIDASEFAGFSGFERYELIGDTTLLGALPDSLVIEGSALQLLNIAGYLYVSNAAGYDRWTFGGDDILVDEDIRIVNHQHSGGVSISGTAQAGVILSASSTLGDADGLGTLHYQWQADGSNVGTDASTYAPVAGDVGKAITVSVYYTDVQGHFEIARSAATDAVAPAAVFTETRPLTSGGEVWVSTSPYTQESPAVTGLEDGGWVVTWMSFEEDGGGYGIYQKRFDADGNEINSSRVNGAASVANDQRNPSVTALHDGGWVVTWMADQDGDGFGIYQQRYSASGAQVGSENLVNNSVTGAISSQELPAVTALEDGGWAVAWISFNQDGYGGGIYQQRYSAAGVKVGGENQVNDAATGADHDQRDACLTGLADGGWVVTWKSSQDNYAWGVYQQRYDAAGAKVGSETLVNDELTSTNYHQEFPSVTALASGGWLTTWMATDQDGYDWGVFQQLFDASGAKIGGEVQVNTAFQYDQRFPKVTALADGGWVITWKSNADTDGAAYNIYQQVFASDGTPVGGETLVNTFTVGEQEQSAISGLADGGWVVTWQSNGQDGSASGIYQQRYLPRGVTDTAASDDFDPVTGNIAADEGGWTYAGSATGRYGSITVNADGSYSYTPDDHKINLLPAGSFTDSFAVTASKDGAVDREITVQIAITGADDRESQVNTWILENQVSSNIATLKDGGWIVTWQSDNQDGDSIGIFFQRYDSTGAALGAELQANTTFAGTQDRAHVAALEDGGWVITWSSADAESTGIYQQRYAADGSLVGSESPVNSYTDSTQENPKVTGLADGGWLVTWSSYGQDGDGYGVYQKRFAADGSAGADILVNSTASDWQFSSAVTALEDGGWVVTWESFQAADSSGGIFQKRFAADGTAGAEVQVNTETGNAQTGANLSSLADGGWLVTWSSYGHDEAGGFGIFQQRYTAAGNATGGEVQVNSHTLYDQMRSSTAGLSGGGWVVVWESNGQDANGSGVFLQIYAADGSLVGGELQVNATSRDAQSNPRVDALPDGGFLVTWDSNEQDSAGSWGIYQARFAADGSRLSHSEQSGVAAPETLSGSANANDLITGIDVEDVVLGLAGDDIFETNNGDFTSIDGGAGDDVLRISQSTDLEAVAAKLTAVEHLRVSEVLADGTQINGTAAQTLEIRADYTFDGILGIYDIWESADGDQLWVDSDIQIENHAASATLAFSAAPQVGAELSAIVTGLADADGLPALEDMIFSWFVDGNYAWGLSTFTPDPADAGKPVYFTVAYTDAQGHAESFSSASATIIGVTGASFRQVSSDTDDLVPADSITNQSTADLIFEYTGSDLAAGTSFQYSVDGTTWQTVVPGDVDTEGDLVYLKTQDTSSSSTFSLRAINELGQASTLLGSQTITYDATAPNAPTLSWIGGVSNDSGASDSDLITNVDRPYVRVSLTGTNALVGDLITVYTHSPITDATHTVTSDDLETGYVDIQAATLEYESDGAHYYDADITDAAGNTSTLSNAVNITYDTTAPAVAFTSLDDDAGSITGNLNVGDSTDDTELGLSGTCELGAIVKVFDGLSYLGDASVLNGSWSFTASLVNGSSYAFNVTATDEAGNESSPTGSVNITADTSAPTLTVSGVDLSDDAGHSNTDFVTSVEIQTITAVLSGNLADGDKLFGRLNGSDWIDISSKVSGTAVSWDNATLVGSNSIEFKLADAVGNEGSITGSQAYVLDTTPPTTEVSTIALSNDSHNDFRVNQMSQTVSGTLSATLAAGEKVVITVDGTNYDYATANEGSNSWSWTGSLSGSDITVWVQDQAGNDGAASNQSYTIDTTAPDLQSISFPGSPDLNSPTTFTFTFSENVREFDLSDINCGSNGIMSGLSSNDNGITWTALFTPNDFDPHPGQSMSVTVGSVEDYAGNVYVGNYSIPFDIAGIS